MQEILLIRQAAVAIASAIGSYTDYKTGYIYDWITYPLIALGIILNLYEQEYTGLVIGAAVYALGWAVYNYGKLGGGDVKLYTGIALALPYYNGTPFIIPAVLFSSLSGLVFISAYYTIKYFRKGIDYELNKEGIGKAMLFTALLAVYFAVTIWSGAMNSTAIFAIGLPMACGVFFLAFEMGIKKEFFLKKIKLKEAEEDEIIAIEFMDKKAKEKIGKALKPVMQQKEIMELEKIGIKEILVFRDLPRFGPFIFIGVIIGFFFPGLSFIMPTR